MRELGEFARLGLPLPVLAVCSQNEVELAALRAKLGQAIELIPDPELRIIKAWGMEDTHASPNHPLARAGVFQIDPSGRILRRWLAASVHERVDPADVKRAVEGS